MKWWKCVCVETIVKLIFQHKNVKNHTIVRLMQLTLQEVRFTFYESIRKWFDEYGSP